jgi:hypothetical protein
MIEYAFGSILQKYCICDALLQRIVPDLLLCRRKYFKITGILECSWATSSVAARTNVVQELNI